MNKRQNNNNLEKAFQEYLSNLESNPKGKVWENICDELLDLEFKSNLDALEVPASEEVWNDITSVVVFDQTFSESLNSLEVPTSDAVINNVISVVALDQVFNESLNNLEISPSNIIWENICAEQLDASFKSNLDALAVSPSDVVWNNVISVVSLDELFSNSLDTIEISPATNIWNEISNTIEFDQHFEHSFQEFIEKPNPEVWDAISNYELERQYRQKLKGLEIKPDDENWEIIKRAIPTLLPLRALLPHLSRIAAILVVAISLPFLFNQTGLFNKASTLSVVVNTPVEMDQLAAFSTPKNIVANTATTTSKSIEPIVAVAQVPSSATSLSNISAENVNPSNLTPTNSQATQVSTSTVSSNALTNPPISNVKEFSAVTIESKIPETFFNKLDTEKNSGIAAKNEIDIQSLRSEKLNSSATYNSSKIESIVTSLKGDGNSSEFDELKLSDKLFSLTDNPRAVKMLNYSGLYVYLSTQFSNTWIVNKEVQRQLSEIESAKYRVGFGGSAGAGFGFRFSPRVALQGGWSRTTLNQKYREFIETEQLYVNNELKTDYNTYQILGKYTLNRIRTNRRNPITSSLAFGLHCRNLKSTILASDVEFDKSVFINKEFGVTGGLDIDFHLSEWVSLNLGARASIGTDGRDLSSISAESRFNNEYGVQAAIQYKISH